VTLAGSLDKGVDLDDVLGGAAGGSRVAVLLPPMMLDITMFPTRLAFGIGFWSLNPGS
jgi:hypothetical protein